ncbi:MAG TPA: sigma-70 family RNA polymerase sigma factor [Thermoanaerobaculia bacterium]|nr:sigma-70 family RNA polymerase sigma factor [Thermoanaerobaculia bacterium]HTS00981.1 sigma-70 family RNA polymerase sigma factor [Thermoanaerobaculia bacterium]
MSDERSWNLGAEIERRVRRRFDVDPAGLESRVREAVASGTRPDRLALDDLYLAAACAAGEEAAWEELSRRHFPFIRDFAMRCTRRDPPASDVAERVIADLWQRAKIRQFGGRSSLRTWLGTLVAHAASNALAAMRRDRPLEDAGEPSRAPDGEDRDLSALARATAAALQALDADARLLLLLYYEQSLTLEQISPMLGVSKATLSRRLAEVRSRLRQEIATREKEETGADASTTGGPVDFGRVDFDLSALLAAPPDTKKRGRGRV